MKNNNEKKEKGTFSDILKKASDFGAKTVDLGKKAADGIQSGAKAISEKAKKDSYRKRLEKFNPLFPKDFRRKDFNLPNMVMIVDDAVRREIDVCEGAIGWLDKENDTEILYLYDEWVEKSGLQFIPIAKCDEIYYVDSFNRSRFVRVDCIFKRAHEEKLAELERIAYLLGAKSCSIEIVESDNEITADSKKIASKIKIGKVSLAEDGEKSTRSATSNLRSGRTTTQFIGHDNPQMPQMKWFANDDNIKGLIEMRFSKSVQSKTLILEGSSSATMSQKAAYAIDCVVGKMGNRARLDMIKEALRESSSKLIFEIEF